jgi:hypothetical protein
VTRSVATGLAAPTSTAINHADQILYIQASTATVSVNAFNYATGKMLAKVYQTTDPNFVLVGYNSKTKCLVGTTYTGTFDFTPAVATINVQTGAYNVIIETSFGLTVGGEALFDDETGLLYVSCWVLSASSSDLSFLDSKSWSTNSPIAISTPLI